MKLLGLTGNIACGKSTVASLLRERGAAVLDADLLVHELYSDKEFAARVAALFEADVLNSLGMVDRAKLSSQVFGDSARLRQLEVLVHPAVAALRDEKLQAFESANEPPPVVVLEAVKLIESGQAAGCRAVWCVVCDEAVQLQRLMKLRNLAEEPARKRIAAQPPFEQKQRLMNELDVPLVLIHNNGTQDELESKVEQYWHRFIATEFPDAATLAVETPKKRTTFAV